MHADPVKHQHTIFVNVGGKAQHPVVTLWCADCLETIKHMDQVNSLGSIFRQIEIHSQLR